MADPPAPIPKSEFANIDARVRCTTTDCWGDLMLMPAGGQDDEGFPAYQSFTTCPLCMTSFDLDDDITDKDLYLKIAWLRANPDAMPGESGPVPPG